MATKAEAYRYVEQRSGLKKAKRTRKPPRHEKLRTLESSRTRGQDIRVNHPYRPPT